MSYRDPVEEEARHDHDLPPDDERIDVARDLRNDAAERGVNRPRPVSRCRCGAWHEHPICPECGRRIREARSVLEVRWMRNYGFEPTSEEIARFPGAS